MSRKIQGEYRVVVGNCFGHKRAVGKWQVLIVRKELSAENLRSFVLLCAIRRRNSKFAYADFGWKESGDAGFGYLNISWKITKNDVNFPDLYILLRTTW